VKNLERLGQLSGIVAHDFNNLLCSIMGHAELLKLQVPLDAKVQLRTQTILDACQRGASLTQQLLTFGGGANSVFRTVDVSRVVARVVELFQPELPDELSLHFEPDGPLKIEADPSLLANAVMNLLVNSRDATQSPGEIRVSVNTHRLPAQLAYRSDRAPEPGDSCIGITVSDSGKGFSNEAMDHLFEPFFSTKQMGHGLGLSSVIGFLDTHGGGISVGNDGGATVSLFFPRSDKPEFMLEELVGASSGNGQWVWLIDDDRHVLEFASLALQAAGYEVRSFSTGAKAFQASIGIKPEETPDLIVLDMSVKSGGFDTLADLRSAGLNSPVLWISGFTSEKLSKYPDIGPNNFLQKPFAGSKLAERVAYILRDS
jgi:CheY-like chemotaxis protein